MDEDLEKKIAAALDRPGGVEGDKTLAARVAKDPQAQRYARGLAAMDAALRKWPAPQTNRTGKDWETLAQKIDARLGEVPSGDFDPMKAPVFDDDASVPKEREQKAMGQAKDNKDSDDDLEGLAALVRTSLPPDSSARRPSLVPGPSLTDDAMDESSGVVDIKTLAEIAKKQSIPPPAPEPTEAKAAEAKPSDEKKPEKKSEKSSEAKEAKSEKKGDKPKLAAVPSATSAGEKSSKSEAKPAAAAAGGSGLVWFIPVAAAAAIGGGFFMLRGGTQADSAPAPTAMVQASHNESEQPSTVTVARAPTQTNFAAAQPVAPPQGTAGEGTLAQVGAAPAPTPADPAAPPPPAQPTQPTTPPPVVVAANTTAPTEREPSGGAPGGTVGAAPANAAPAALDRDQRLAVAETAPAPRGAGSEESEVRRPRRAARATESNEAAEPATTTTRPAPPPAQPTVAAAAPTPAPARPAAAAPAAPATPPAATTGATGRGRSVDELMRAAVGPSATPQAETQQQPAAEALPERPSRAQVTSTLTPLNGAVRACTQGQTGTATVAMVINGDGSVATANVTSPFAGGVNDCIAGVVRRARFPRFSRPSVPIAYPFSILPRNGE